MNDLNNTQWLVTAILRNCEEARNSDVRLYLEVCRLKNPAALKSPFSEVITNLKGYGLPPFETVGRCRRKAQREFPELAANAQVKAGRDENEQIFREFARGEHVG